MKKTPDVDPRVAAMRARTQRLWLMGGIVPLAVATVLMLAVTAVWASPSQADEHTVQRGFQAVLAVCAGLFLTGFWLDGKWTSNIAARVWRAAGGDEFTPTSSQLAAQADIAVNTITASLRALAIIGAGIAASAVVSVWAGLSIGDGFQLILLGLSYQLFVLSRCAHYDDVVTAAVAGELVAVEDDQGRRRHSTNNSK